MEIYLAGAFVPYENNGKKYSDWRDFVAEYIVNHRIIDPRRDSRQTCPATFTADDARHADSCDCLLHYRVFGEEGEGGSWEHGIAVNSKKSHEGKKLVIYVDDNDIIWPLNSASASVTFANLEAAVWFLSRINSVEKSEWLKVFRDGLNLNRQRKRLKL